MRYAHDSLYKEVLTLLVEDGWNANFEKLRVDGQITGAWENDVSVEAIMSLEPDQERILSCFVVNTTDHTNRLAQPFLGYLEKKLTQQGFIIEQPNPSTYRFYWIEKDADLFDDSSPEEIKIKMMRQFKKGCNLVYSYSYIVRGYVLDTSHFHKRLTNPRHLVDLCLHGFGIDPPRYNA